jgi:hypothetical protein
MKEIEIDLSQPFESVIEAVLALPNGSVNGTADHGLGEKELREAIRGLYEAANGRQAETEIGLIPIAPPIAPFLKAKPFRAATLKDFLVAAAAQIVSLPLHRNGRRTTSSIANRHLRARSGSHDLPPRGPDFLTPQTTAAHHD